MQIDSKLKQNCRWDYKDLIMIILQICIYLPALILADYIHFDLSVKEEEYFIILFSFSVSIFLLWMFFNCIRKAFLNRGMKYLWLIFMVIATALGASFYYIAVYKLGIGLANEEGKE